MTLICTWPGGNLCESDRMSYKVKLTLQAIILYRILSLQLSFISPEVFMPMKSIDQKQKRWSHMTKNNAQLWISFSCDMSYNIFTVC